MIFKDHNKTLTVFVVVVVFFSPLIFKSARYPLLQQTTLIYFTWLSTGQPRGKIWLFETKIGCLRQRETVYVDPSMTHFATSLLCLK